MNNCMGRSRYSIVANWKVRDNCWLRHPSSTILSACLAGRSVPQRAARDQAILQVSAEMEPQEKRAQSRGMIHLMQYAEVYLS